MMSRTTAVMGMVIVFLVTVLLVAGGFFFVGKFSDGGDCICPSEPLDHHHEDEDEERRPYRPLLNEEVEEIIARSVIKPGDICYAINRRDRRLQVVGNAFRAYRIYAITVNKDRKCVYHTSFQEGKIVRGATFFEDELVVVGTGTSPTPVLPYPGSTGSTPVPSIGDRPQ